MADWLADTMRLEVDTMTGLQEQEPTENVQNIVNEYRDIVVQ